MCVFTTANRIVLKVYEGIELESLSWGITLRTKVLSTYFREDEKLDASSPLVRRLLGYAKIAHNGRILNLRRAILVALGQHRQIGMSFFDLVQSDDSPDEPYVAPHSRRETSTVPGRMLRGAATTK
jgi:IS4 transposase